MEQNHALPDEGEKGTEAREMKGPTTSEGALEFMWQAFSNLNEWVRFSDTKAAVVLAADGVIIGALITLLVGSRPKVLDSGLVVLWLFCLVLSTFYSAAFALASLLPQLSIGNKKKPVVPARANQVEEAASAEESSSLVFFLDIDRNFPSAKEFHETINRSLADTGLAISQISQQVWANSKVAAIKYRHVTHALWGLLATLCLAFAGTAVLGAHLLLKALSR